MSSELKRASQSRLIFKSQMPRLGRLMEYAYTVVLDRVGVTLDLILCSPSRFRHVLSLRCEPRRVLARAMGAGKSSRWVLRCRYRRGCHEVTANGEFRKPATLLFFAPHFQFSNSHVVFVEADNSDHGVPVLPATTGTSCQLRPQLRQRQRCAGDTHLQVMLLIVFYGAGYDDTDSKMMMFV